MNEAVPLLEDENSLDLALRRYAREASRSDLMLGAGEDMAPRWQSMLRALGAAGHGGLAGLQERAAQQVLDLGMAFRLAGEREERVWPLSPVPLLLHEREWSDIAAGLAQRADLLEAILDDVYGPETLVADGDLPAAALAGSADYWRQMIGVVPARGNRLLFYAADIARGPDGSWRVLSDHVRTPVGAGYALENRLAMNRSTDDLLGRMNLARLAPFFATFRQGLASNCARVEPRIALLSQGRFNQSYAEQAHLARYLGFLLVEGDDLMVQGSRLYVRTIEGLKRIDGLWRRMGTQLLDPLAFDSRSRIGVPDLFEALKGGDLAVANWPGAGVVESPVLAAFLPRLCQKLLGEDLRIPNIATWWCGQEPELEIVRSSLDSLAIGSAFGRAVPGIPHGRPRLAARFSEAERAAVLAELASRPMDYVGQELVQLSTTPALVHGKLVPRPFILRAFLARAPDGSWRAMPGGLARLAHHEDMRAVLMGEGDMSADVCVIGEKPTADPILLDTGPTPAIRRVPGTLPSKAADNFFWLSRYLERGEMVLRMLRALLGDRIAADGGSTLEQRSLRRLADMLVAWNVVDARLLHGSVTDVSAAALTDRSHPNSVPALFEAAEAIGRGLRERLAADFWRQLNRQIGNVAQAPAQLLIGHVGRLIDRCATLSGLANENMVRGQGWRFLDIGRRLERAVHLCRLMRRFACDEASGDDLNLLLDLADCQISFRTRYLAGLSVAPVRDMLALEPDNPRSLAFQIDRIVDNLDMLPRLHDDGMPEPPMRIARALAARLAAQSAETLSDGDFAMIEQNLLDLSDAIGARYFLKGEEAQRASGMTRLA